jgi:hypothetical protein
MPLMSESLESRVRRLGVLISDDLVRQRDGIRLREGVTGGDPPQGVLLPGVARRSPIRKFFFDR